MNVSTAMVLPDTSDGDQGCNKIILMILNGMESFSSHLQPAPLATWSVKKQFVAVLNLGQIKINRNEMLDGLETAWGAVGN